MPNTVTTNTLIPIGFALTLLAAAVSFGVMYQKVNTVNEEVGVLRIQMADVSSKIDQLIGRQSIVTRF